MAVEQTAERREFPEERFEPVRQERAWWVLLVLGLLAVAILQIWLAGRIVTPWIMIDELIYSDLARSLGDHGSFHVRGEPIAWSNFGYVALLAPAWLVSEAQSTAYALAKAINVSLGLVAIVLVYAWGRRLTAGGWALIAAGLTALMPSLLYAGTLMSENGFLPAFLLAALAIAGALEQPTLRRQGLAFAAIGLAGFVRVQGVVLLAILPTAILFAAVAEARLAPAGARLAGAVGYLRRFWPTAAALVCLALVYAAVKTAQGLPLATGLGGYQAVAEADYSFADVARWLARHFADLSLATGVFPVSALIMLLGLAVVRGTANAAERAFVATAVAATTWILFQASLFASSFAFRIEERNMFCVFPLVFLALAVWLARGAPRRPSALAGLAAAAPAVAIAFALPLRELLGMQILSDTFGLIPLLRLSQLLSGGVDDVVILLTAGAVAAAIVFLLLPARFTLVLPFAMAVFFVLSTYAVHGAIRSYAAQLDVATNGTDRSWIDRAARGEQVDYVYGSGDDPVAEGSGLWQAEFWNPSLDDVYNIGIAPPFALTEVPAPLDRGDGRLQAPGPPDDLVVSGARLGLAGTTVARHGPLVVTRLARPARVGMTLEGVYGDGWTGATAALTQYVTRGNRPRRLRIALSRAAWRGKDVPARVTVRLGPAVDRDGVAAIERVTARREWTAHAGKSRVFTFRTPRPPYRLEVFVKPTFSPSRLGGGDTRELGVQLALRQR